MPGLSAKLRDAAAQVAAESPPKSGWPDAGLVMPHADWIRFMRRTNWPMQTVEVVLPAEGHTSPSADGRRGTVHQPVTVVPESWLRRMAELLQVRWADACRGKID